MLQSWARVCNGRGYQAALGACPQVNTPHQRPHSPASWSPTDHATKPLWEACWQANIRTPEGRIRQQAGLPRIMPRSCCGKLAGKRISEHQRAAFASKLVSHGSCHEAAVGSLLASEYPNTRGPHSPASWSPTDHAMKLLWEACWQANRQRPWAFAAKRSAARAAFHSGAVAPSEWMSSR